MSKHLTTKIDLRAVDFDGLNIETIDNLMKKLDEVRTNKREQLKSKGVEEIRKIAAQYGMSKSDFGVALGIKVGVSSVAPKYRDPATGLTWSGRGRKPAWCDTATMAIAGMTEMPKEDQTVEKAA